MDRKDRQKIAERRKGDILRLELLDNIQFIYELHLAKLEVEALGSLCNILEDYRSFFVNSNPDKGYLKRRLAYFKTVDSDFTNYYHILKHNITRSPNQYLTHWFYPYKGKFHPQMIRALLNIMGVKEGEVVLDPFIGSGTTALECQLLGIDCIGVDVSPLCVLISKTKTQSLNVLDELEGKRFNPEDFVNRALLTRQGSLLVREVPGVDYEKEGVKNFHLLAEMIAHSDRSRRSKDFERSLHENIQKMLISIRSYKSLIDELDLRLGRVNIMQGDARDLDLEDESVDGIITSPPYSIALNYVANDAHSLSALGYDLNRIKEEFIGVRGVGLKRFELYNQDMFLCVKEMNRVLKKGKYCVIVIGNVTFQNKEIDTTGTIIEFCNEVGLKLKKRIDKVIFGLYNVMQREYILVFKKGG